MGHQLSAAKNVSSTLSPGGSLEKRTPGGCVLPRLCCFFLFFVPPLLSLWVFATRAHTAHSQSPGKEVTCTHGLHTASWWGSGHGRRHTAALGPCERRGAPVQNGNLGLLDKNLTIPRWDSRTSSKQEPFLGRGPSTHGACAAAHGAVAAAAAAAATAARAMCPLLP